MNAKDKISKIVVGIDGSESAAEALTWTIDLARQTGAEIVAVSALAPPNYAEYAGMALVAPIEFDPQFQAELESTFRLTWCRPLAESGLPYRAVFASGRPAAVLTSVAEAEGADLVVVGRRGRGGFAELVLGSVSHELTHRCAVPVVLISHHKTAKHPIPGGIQAVAGPGH
jgi:nucleotide-binding universal stress UspA family protein